MFGHDSKSKIENLKSEIPQGGEMKKKFVLLALLAFALIALAACATPTPTPAPTAVPKPTDAPKPTAVPPTTAPQATAVPKPTDAPKPTDVPKPTVRTKANPGEKITLYHFGDVTGPLAAITTPLVSGFTDGVKYLNSKGGIRGAEVVIEWADTGGKLENAISTYNRFREKKPLVMQLYGSGETEALRDRAAEDKIPVLTAGVSAKGSYPPGWVYAVVPIYSDQFGLFADWLATNWAKVKPAKGQATDSPKIAFVTWDTAYGRAALSPETRAFAESKGVKIVAEELFTAGAPDVTTQILAAKKAGANVIYTNSLATGPAQVLKDVVSLGVRDEFLVAGNNWAIDSSMLALSGAASEGFYGVFPNLWFDDTDNPGVKLILDQFAANQRKPAERSVGYLLSFSLVDSMRQILEKTIDRVGFDGLNGAAVNETIMTMGEIKAMDGVMVLGYGKDVRATNKARIVQVQKGKFVYQTDWMTTPDLRPK
jgi:branched-chain amino acid transport system substrate-binding protein